MKPVQAILIGAGHRGLQAFGNFALQCPHELRFVAVAEPNDERRRHFARLHGVPKERQFKSHTDLLQQRPLTDLAVNATMDRTHVETTLPLLEAGYHVLLEKPMANTPADCVRLIETARRHNRLLLIGYVLRYTPFFRTIHRLIREGRVGRIIAMHHQENVSYWHQAHSFVRGKHSRSDLGSPMILQKSSHDLDIIRWLVDSPCLRLSSFGGRAVFRSENAPEGAADRCTDGCPAESDCPYSTLKIYFNPDIPNWMKTGLSIDTSHDALMKALREGPLGRCVYKCDNDVVDHQVANLEFENSAKVGFTMWGLSHENTRTLRIAGDKATLRGHLRKRLIEIHHYNTGDVEHVHVGKTAGGHGGGDHAMMKDVCAAIRTGNLDAVTSAADASLDSHLMAFAAETSRLENGRVVQMSEYRREINTALAQSR